ncbi:MAG TPA: Holliday junction branch migration protein RuvA [Sphingobacterium sp.]|nr:Holliday junction branch migration protein RuvA [Sphingobacterium sp.]
MYEYLRGSVITKAPTYVVLEVGGIGYYVHITLSTYSQIKDVDECKLFISFQVREDAHNLYGFATEEERQLFTHLISISGIGPSTGRMMLSSSTSEELQRAIINGEVETMKKIKGIGPKTAQRIILELQDKLKKTDEGVSGGSISDTKPNVVEEALSALILLGFAKKTADKALQTIYKQNNDLSVEALIKAALKKL